MTGGATNTVGQQLDYIAIEQLLNLRSDFSVYVYVTENPTENSVAKLNILWAPNVESSLLSLLLDNERYPIMCWHHVATYSCCSRLVVLHCCMNTLLAYLNTWLLNYLGWTRKKVTQTFLLHFTGVKVRNLAFIYYHSPLSGALVSQP